MSEVQLTDFISGQTMSLNEWIKHELTRIQNKIEPRHCPSYSELIQVIEEPFRFQSDKRSNSSAASPSQTSPNTMFYSSYAAKLHVLERIKTNLIPETELPTSAHLYRAFFLLLQSNVHSPQQLLSELDRLRLALKQKKPIDSFRSKTRLMRILFGKIQLTHHLVRPWQIVCQWFAILHQAPHLIFHWIQLTLAIFVVAKTMYTKKLTFPIQPSLRAIKK
ncbi:hypothetical protein G6F46_002469 [Rhizopus delemar]|nr:hypothetical protein G6F55_001288 [Rhizopus delemar]KAG1552973.1 hypothetical protein G6F51_000880 [Rhizopus arrhizus]KAG1503139.1 hypothetical protein G6F54_001876 [Rhizopus delemar]KAG1516574.1 hypothetical protein G6F53_002047 [Rhizopus delemar]KAG1528306.1 hypothetical protein G6F52_000758 [Rhizopus delemar]